MLLPASDLSRLRPFHLLPWLWLLCLTVIILIITISTLFSLQDTRDYADPSSAHEQKAGSSLAYLVSWNVQYMLSLAAAVGKCTAF